MLLQPGSRPVPNYPDYQLVRKLGAGAFGDVWHARGPGGVDVALKFIRLDSAARYLELRSLEVMKSKRHPNLVSLSGYWRTDDWLILAMELCDGTLQDRLADALDRKLPGIPPDELLNYMRDAASGLDYLNDTQVQHRDVKPANLLVLGNGERSPTSDWRRCWKKRSAATRAWERRDTWPPEGYRGKVAQQSDQYSLAVTYYHLRTGHLLYKGNHAEVMYAHLEGEPDLSRLPPAETTVLARALAKEPSKRWESCSGFVDELGKARQTSVRHNAEQRERKNAAKVHDEKRQGRVEDVSQKVEVLERILQEAERRRVEEEQQKRESMSIWEQYPRLPAAPREQEHQKPEVKPVEQKRDETPKTPAVVYFLPLIVLALSVVVSITSKTEFYIFSSLAVGCMLIALYYLVRAISWFQEHVLGWKGE